MIRAIALRVLVISALGVGVSYASAFRAGGPPAWGIWLFIVAMPSTLIATMTLGAIRGGAEAGRSSRRGDALLVAVFLGMLALLVGGFAAALALPTEASHTVRLWFGLPARAAIVLYGIGVLPLFALPLVYALTFERVTLSDADLERVRAARGRRSDVGSSE